MAKPSVLQTIDEHQLEAQRIEAERKIREKEHLTVDGDENRQAIVSVSTSIKTLEEALSAAKVNLAVWAVERYVVNKWDGFNKNVEKHQTYTHGRATGSIHQHRIPVITPLWQVKVWLKRKDPILTAAEELLERIADRSPLIRVKPRPSPKRGHRSLEVSVMDPHVGLVTAYPQGDGPQDLRSIAESILAAYDDLIAKAKPFGPFEEAFMPFGNDFLHVDNVFHTTTAGTNQPEAEAWHKIYVHAEMIAIEMVKHLQKAATKVFIYEVPGNHSRMADFTLARIIRAYFRNDPSIIVDASASPYKFHRYGKTLIGYDHGHSIAPIRLAALMANERPKDWKETEFREWHLGDQHRKGSGKPSVLEEQGVSVEYLPGLTVPNEWHRIKSFNHQKRGAYAFVYDKASGPVARLQHNISMYTHKPMGE